MTFLELKTQLRDEIFFGDEQENLVTAHDNCFQRAMYDLQRAVPCYRFGNKDVYPQCSSYFECGLTVVPKPTHSEIVEVYTIDKIDPATGLENPLSSDDWCAKVFYHPVRFCELQQFRRLCERVPSSSILSVADSLASLWWGVYRNKHSYPRPTDEGLETQPVLPGGMHYPQASTNAGGRSPGGRFAINVGRLYIAPWLESTESLVVKWNGIKRKWSNADFVDDDPKVLQALQLNVAIQHYTLYEHDHGKLAELKAAYGNPDLGQWGALQDLIDECRRETEAASCRQADWSTSAARGFGPSNEFSYFNTIRVARTATCPAGQTGNAVTVVKEIGSVGSMTSVEDANSRAALEAFAEATARLGCVTAPVTYSSLAVIGHASCPGPLNGAPAAEGPDTTADLPAGFATSPISVEAATAIAQTAADALAAQKLVCTFYNKAQTVSYHCPSGQVQTGDDGTATVPAGTPPFSGPSQAYADQLAYNEALRLATIDFTDNGGTCDAAPPVLVYNEPQSVGPVSRPCQRTFILPQGPQVCFFTVNVTANISGGRVARATLGEANIAAQQIASAYLNSVVSALGFCNQFAQVPGHCIDHYDQMLTVP